MAVNRISSVLRTYFLGNGGLLDSGYLSIDVLRNSTVSSSMIHRVWSSKDEVVQLEKLVTAIQK